MADQEKIHGAWNPTQDSNGNWNVPTSVGSKNVQTSDLV